MTKRQSVLARAAFLDQSIKSGAMAAPGGGAPAVAPKPVDSSESDNKDEGAGSDSEGTLEHWLSETKSD